jgi:hypothetical protein
MKTISILILLTIVSTLNAREVRTASQLKRQVKKVKREEAFSYIRDFVKETKPSRMVGAAGHAKAISFLKKKIDEMDPEGSGKVTSQTFLPNTKKGALMYELDFRKEIVGSYTPSSDIYKKWDRFTKYMVKEIKNKQNTKGTNIIWEKKGANEKEVLIIGAHYDTISHDKESLLIKKSEVMPGADYNASGVAVALGIIKLLSNYELKKTVRVVFFDYQGFGYLGSSHYVDELSKEVKEKKIEVAGLVNLEMLGHDSKHFDKKKKNGNMALYINKPEEATHMRDKSLAEYLLKMGQKFTRSVRFDLRPNGFDSSDNFRFWEKGFSAVTFTQDWEDDFNTKNYQTTNDFPETLNQRTFYEAYIFISGAVASWALSLEK